MLFRSNKHNLTITHVTAEEATNSLFGLAGGMAVMALSLLLMR